MSPIVEKGLDRIIFLVILHFFSAEKKGHS